MPSVSSCEPLTSRSAARSHSCTFSCWGNTRTLAATPPAVARRWMSSTIVEDIQRRATAGGVAASVLVLPQQENVHEWLRAADLLVSGSHEDTEGMSRVLYEAMACGAVPIATDIRGNREAVTPETGVLV